MTDEHITALETSLDQLNRSVTAIYDIRDRVTATGLDRVVAAMKDGRKVDACEELSSATGLRSREALYVVEGFWPYVTDATPRWGD
jgi:hypothetical protein